MGCATSKNKQVETPWTFTSHSRQEWIAWRNCFLTYMDEQYVPTYKQGAKFFKLIGNIGVGIAKNFYYRDIASETDINTLLFKFDVYFIFGCRKRHANESIDDYVLALREIAEKTAKSSIEKILKEKLLQDMISEKIFEQFLEIVPSFAKIADYESLALHELICVWKECEKSKQAKLRLFNGDAQKRDAIEQIQLKNPCLQCDEIHADKKCRALGKKCRKCGNYDHFAKCCSKALTIDCPNCGTNHAQNQCPAFAKECPRCRKMNHFLWQCFAESIICNQCGQSHIHDRQQCPAINNTCNNCQKIGHFSYMCMSRRNKM